MKAARIMSRITGNKVPILAKYINTGVWIDASHIPMIRAYQELIDCGYIAKIQDTIPREPYEQSK
jgi:hypothetical protein